MDVNTILTILSIIVTLISIIMGIKQLNITIFNLLCFGIVILECITIFLLHNQRKKLGLSIPKSSRIADYKLYKQFWKKEIISKDLPNRKNLENGFLHIFGNDVEKYQVLLIDFISNRKGGKIIYAVDITTNPKLLLTRKEYHKKNKEFIEAKNIINRILLIDKKNLKDISFVNDLYSVITLNRKIGVHINLITTNFLKPNQIMDFIIYDKSVAIIEGHQAAENYTAGDSQLWFLSYKIELLKETFNEIYNKAKFNDQCNKFMDSCNVKKGSVIDFEIKSLF